MHQGSDSCESTEDQKSLTQKAQDTLSGQPGEKGIVEQVQEGAEAVYNYAKDTATGMTPINV